MLSFPIDLAFLAISFSAIILPYMQARPENPLSTRDVMFWFLTYIVIAFVVTIFTRHSDKAFAEAKKENILPAVLWAMPAYFLSILIIVLSLRTMAA